MNKERFLELAEQAGFIFWADEDWRPKGNTIDWSSNYDEELAKFAELIVRECAEVGYDSVEDGDDIDAIMRRVHTNILKHFGVEE
jgi:hypothetical protein